MQRNRRHGVEPVIPRHGGCQQIAQGALQRPDPAVLVEVNQLPKGAFVSPKTVSRVKTAQPIAAEGATALFIQRKTVLKWGAATAAEEFRVQRLWSVEANAADWNPRDLVQGLTANAAIVGEK